jgi:hypothetical protein
MKHIQFNGQKMTGCVDLGTGVEPSENTPAAGEALTFMVVALDASWKLSIGYFLISGLKADDKADILKMALRKLHDIGMKTANVTCDGPATNFSVFKKLGASFDIENLTTTFPHPSDSELKVAVIFDACHMIKLVRNTLSFLKVLVDPEGNQIKWEFITKLHDLQQKEGLRAANKLKQDHISWHKQKMKVNLATQTLSLSVANSIDFCRDQLKLPEFQNSQATTKFIRFIDSLFDVMNSRNPFSKGFKAPMKVCNKEKWSTLFSESYTYISNVSDLQGTKMINTPRHTAFIGFLINIRSLEFLFETLVEEGSMIYLLTYKLSQDHLELFFCALRCRLGQCTNPTVPQFKAAYKRLLLHQEIRGNKGNCILQDDTSILTFQMQNKNVGTFSLWDFALQKQFGLDFEQTDHDYTQVSCYPILSEFKTSVMEYIAGYSIKMTMKLLKCETCFDVITEQSRDSNYLLVRAKDKGGLIYVSRSTRIVCKTTEQAIQTIVKTTEGLVTFKNGLSAAITSSVLKTIHESFP